MPGSCVLFTSIKPGEEQNKLTTFNLAIMTNSSKVKVSEKQAFCGCSHHQAHSGKYSFLYLIKAKRTPKIELHPLQSKCHSTAD